MARSFATLLAIAAVGRPGRSLRHAATPGRSLAACEIEDGIDIRGDDIAAEPALPLDYDQLDRASQAKACSAACSVHGASHFSYVVKRDPPRDNCWCNLSNEPRTSVLHLSSGRASQECSASPEPKSCDFKAGYGYGRDTRSFAASAPSIHQCSALCADRSEYFTFQRHCYCKSSGANVGRKPEVISGTASAACSAEAAPTKAAPTEAGPTKAAPEATPAPKKIVALTAAVPEDDWWNIGAPVGGGVVLLGCLLGAYRLWSGESGLGAYIRRVLAMRHYCNMIQDACTEALRSVDPRATFGSPGELFQPPAELPHAQQLKKVLGSPEDLLAVGEDTFQCTVEAAIAFIDDYIAAAERWWTLEDIRSVATARIGNAFVDTYSSVHELIKVKEEDGYTDFQAEIAKNVQKLVPYEALLDKIPEKAERITKLYAEASQVLPHFTKLINQVAESVGGSALVAPLKSPLRVIEKMALRPEKGVPWDIVRAQVQVDSMAKVSQATSLITRSLETDVHRIKDRFSSPHEGGWADCSMNITMVCAWDSAASTVKTGNKVISMGATTSKANKANAPKLVMCEIQVVHEYLMMVREGMKQHDAYDHGRFAAELLTTRGGGFTPPLPWSVREKIESLDKLGRGNEKPA